MTKKEETARRAKAIYDRLMLIDRPAGLSNNEWAAKAGVNTSFFTNLRNGSEPSVGNLRAVLEVVGLSLPEFFASEAAGRLIFAPDERQLIGAIRDALPGLPKRHDRRAEYLADVVQAVLRIPLDRPAIEDREVGPQQVSAAARAATK